MRPEERSNPHLKLAATDEGMFGEGLCIGFTEADLRRRAKWTEARFGLFVHWGLPAIPAGRWRGKRVDGLAEWIQFKEKIPLADYRELATRFTASGFNARHWVRTAANAGAKYVVYTAKHHDGFAMYRSEVSAYNIHDATPFGRDPLAELAVACAEYGVILGLYYSQTIDWEDPNAVGPQCNDWDFDPAKGDFRIYWHRKALPQLKELLSNYGDIGLLWFDMPEGIPPECAKEASDLVRELQPRAVINSRLGSGGEVDYQSMDDNYFNNHLPERDWETAATTNNSWAHSADSGGWKPVPALCEALAYAVSRGGNYLLNVGPDANGALPPEAADQFRGMATWMKRAASGIHGAARSPLRQTFEWGHVTSKGESLFLHVCNPQTTDITLPGLRIGPVRALDLASGNELLHSLIGLPSGHAALSIRLEPPQDPYPRTLELRFAAAPGFTPEIIQPPGCPIRLDTWTAISSTKARVSWEFAVQDPGRYRVVLVSKESFTNADPQWWGEGLAGRLAFTTDVHSFVLNRDGQEDYPITHYWKLIRSDVAMVEIGVPGSYTLDLLDLPIVDSKWDESGVNLVGVRLERVTSAGHLAGPD